MSRASRLFAGIRHGRHGISWVHAAVLIAVVGSAGHAAPAEIIDRILAVVDSSVVTQSDVMAAMRLGLEKPPRSGDAVAGVLDRLIDRRLMLAEVERYAPPDPTAAEVDRGVEAVRRRFPTAPALDEVLKETGLDERQLRQHIRDDLRVDAYLQQRFGSVVQPSEEQVLDYYRSHPEQFSAGGELRPYGEVHDEIRQTLATERRAGTIGEWLTNLRRRANVNVLYLSAPARQGAGTTIRR